MKTSRKTLLLAAIFTMALQLVFSGGAGATMPPDGAQHNGTTGVWELPAYTDIFGCYVGGGTVVDAASRFDCRNTAIAQTLQSACVVSTPVTVPAGWAGVANGTGRWSACSEGGISSTNCVAYGGTLQAFTRCSKQIVNSDCTDLGTSLGLTVTAAGTAATPACTANSTANPGLTAAVCAGYTGSATSGAPYVGSAGVSGGVTTCTFYIGNDLAACAAVGGGTVSTTNTDETRGYCGGNTIDKFLNTDTAANPMGGINADWSATSGGVNGGAGRRRNCLKCHQPAYMDSEIPNYAGGVAKYINASHRNSSRKITPGMNWAQINGVPEVFSVFTNYAGRDINWTNGTIETTAGSGVYTDWYWYWGYYFEDPSAGSDIAENTTGTTGVPWNVITSRGAGGFTACMYCHATGFTAENTQIVTKEPERSFPGSAWDGSVPYDPAVNGAINLRASFNNRSNVDDSVFVPSSADCAALGGTIGPTSGTNPIPVCRIVPASITQNDCVKGGNSIPGTPDWTGAWIGTWSATTGCTVTTAFKYTSWDEFGVLCSNCHNSEEPNHQNNGPRMDINWVADGATEAEQAVSINAVCLQCHAKAGSGNAQNTAMDSEPLANRTDMTTGHPNYHGSEFMNSPHARFSGTYSQVTDLGQYDSAFTTLYGGCNGCHDPHGSVRENLLDPVLMGSAVAEEGITATCASCHATYADADTITVTPANTNHPTGLDTPGCESCHMPGGRHMFRIAADNSTTGADGAYTMAVWNTATTVCQQCHFAGRAAASMPFTADQAATAAKSMHTGGAGITDADCQTCHATFTLTHHSGSLATTCLDCHTNGHGGQLQDNTFCQSCHTGEVPGVNHHGLHSSCIDCHRNQTVPNAASNAFCMSCHTNTGAHAVHHAVASVTATCQSCHTIPGVTVPPMTTRDEITAGCLSCHISAQGGNAPIYPRVGTPDASQTQDNHHRGSSTLHFVTTTNNYGCKGCHGSGAPTATATGLTGAAFCGECHTVTPGTDHHVGACLTCHRADGSFSGTYGAGVTAGPSPELNTSCLTCHATAQGTAQAISSNLAVMNHGTGVGTPASFANACATCHKAPAVVVPAVPFVSFPGVAPVIDATCGQCHGGSAGPGGTTNGAMYLGINYLTSYAVGIHGVAPPPPIVKRKVKVTVFGNQATPAPMPNATVSLKREKPAGLIQVDSGLTDAAGQITFKKLVDGENYQIVVFKAGLDFNGTLTAMQDQAKSTVFLMDMNRTVRVDQGVAATNGPAANPWKGTNGGMTVFTIAP